MAPVPYSFCRQASSLDSHPSRPTPPHVGSGNRIVTACFHLPFAWPILQQPTARVYPPSIWKTAGTTTIASTRLCARLCSSLFVEHSALCKFLLSRHDSLFSRVLVIDGFSVFNIQHLDLSDLELFWRILGSSLVKFFLKLDTVKGLKLSREFRVHARVWY